ncbi:hypothetical protein DL767_010577 [Monosporascus sp. MG133]|nr:hypothetical protein DL767_010577 [Monosporascus sp. MG133]
MSDDEVKKTRRILKSPEKYGNWNRGEARVSKPHDGAAGFFPDRRLMEECEELEKVAQHGLTKRLEVFTPKLDRNKVQLVKNKAYTSGEDLVTALRYYLRDVRRSKVLQSSGVRAYATLDYNDQETFARGGSPGLRQSQTPNTCGLCTNQDGDNRSHATSKENKGGDPTTVQFTSSPAVDDPKADKTNDSSEAEELTYATWSLKADSRKRSSI